MEQELEGTPSVSEGTGEPIQEKETPTGKTSYVICPECGKDRWRRLRSMRTSTYTSLCRSCWIRKLNFQRRRFANGEKHWNWKGGRILSGKGYISVYLEPDDFFYPMAGEKGYVKEHRLVMAKHLGRCLHSWEIVHHKDGIKDHNEYSNLKLTTLGSHSLEHSKGYRDGYQQGLLDGRVKQIEELKEAIENQTKVIGFLRWQIKELNISKEGII